MNLSLPASAGPLLPHKPPMAMIDRIIELSPRQMAATVIRDDNRFLNGDGILDRSVIPELIGQASAACYTYRNSTVRQGFLALARNIRFENDIRCGDEIFISATDENPIENWFVITFEIHTAEHRCAYGEISVCLF